MARTTTATKDMLRYQRGNRGLNLSPKPIKKPKPLTAKQQKKLDAKENARWFKASQELRKRKTRMRP